MIYRDDFKNVWGHVTWVCAYLLNTMKDLDLFVKILSSNVLKQSKLLVYDIVLQLKW